jgi:hypothetical protein
MDPLLFAIYGDTIYHHGAGFRRRGGASRGHYDSRPKPLRVPDNLMLRVAARKIDAARLKSWRLRTRGPQILESKRIFSKIQGDDPDWLAPIR